MDGEPVMCQITKCYKFTASETPLGGSTVFLLVLPPAEVLDEIHSGIIL